MKKIFLSIAILSASVAALAQSPVESTVQSGASNVENAVQKTAVLKDKVGGKHRKDLRKGYRCDMRDSEGRQCRATSIFDGLNLTADQQTKLAALRSKYADERKAERTAMEKDKKADLTKEQKQQKLAEVAAKREASRKNYLAGVKEILTPQQYSTFLENYYTRSNSGHHARIERRDFRKEHRRDHRRDQVRQVSMQATPMTATQQQ